MTKDMRTFQANFHTGSHWAEEEFEAENAEQALAMAKTYLTEHPDDLSFHPHDDEGPVNEISIDGPLRGDEASWHSDDLRLRLAASELAEGLELALLALNTAPRFRVGDTDSYKIAAQIGEILVKAKGGAA